MLPNENGVAPALVVFCVCDAPKLNGVDDGLVVVGVAVGVLVVGLVPKENGVDCVVVVVVVVL